MSSGPIQIQQTLQGTMRLFMDRYVLEDETVTHITTMTGKRGPICEVVEVGRPTVYGVERSAFFISKKVDWFREYSRDYDDPGRAMGMMIRYDIAERAGLTDRSILAIYVESEQDFFAMSGRKYWNYIRAYHRYHDSPYEPGVLDSACPRPFWTRMYSNNKFGLEYG
jgi:hypothetical protein